MALVTLADVKTFLGIENNEKDDLLNLLIEQASKYVETMTNRTLESTVYTEEEYDGSGNKELRLNNFPIITFTKLEVNNATDNSDDWQEINSSDYWVDTDTGVITKTSNYLDWNTETELGLSEDYIFNYGKNRYRATYTAGYATAPADLQYCVMAMISYVFNKRKNMGIVSESLGDHSITFQESLTKDSTINDILMSYRDISLAQ